MTNIDMKQKIKEVRDKFLSSNQIEDIRQNITLGVEERLKFLNSEQIKVVELLEQKHEELDTALKLNMSKIEESKTEIESSFDKEINNLKEMLKENTKKLEIDNNDLLEKNNQLRDQLDKNLTKSITKQEKMIDKKIEVLTSDNTKLRELNAESLRELKDFSSKNLSKMHTTSEKLVADFTLKENSILSSLEEKLSSIETKKSELINEINNKFEATISTLDKKIEEFSENHQTVEDVIDGRLKEFRIAQKAAFEELEAALNLLEKHQDQTITRFKKNSEPNFIKFKGENSDLSRNRNRGSILHQPSEISGNSAATISEVEIVSDQKKVAPASLSKRFSIILIILFTLSIVALYHLDIDYKTLSAVPEKSKTLLKTILNLS